MRINTKTDDGMTRLNKLIEKFNINALLKEAGAKTNDTIYIGDNFFDYREDY